MRPCHACGRSIELDHVGPRDVCEGCPAWLHSCRNCEFYAPGAPKDCREPQAELVADKEQGNFCDYFRLRSVETGDAPDAAEKARDELEKLFRKK